MSFVITPIQWFCVHGELQATSPGEVAWSASDIGWVVGHSFIVYGPLITGCTTVLLKANLWALQMLLHFGALWRNTASTLFTAPTALRAIRKEDPELSLLEEHDVSTLRQLFVAGERADPTQ